MQMWIVWTEMMHIRIFNTFNRIALLSLSSKDFVPSLMLTATTHTKKKQTQTWNQNPKVFHLHQPTPSPFLLHKSIIIQLNDKKTLKQIMVSNT
jgi:hypothetical protein